MTWATKIDRPVCMRMALNGSFRAEDMLEPVDIPKTRGECVVGFLDPSTKYLLSFMFKADD